MDGKVWGNTPDTVTLARKRDHSLDLTDSRGRQASVTLTKEGSPWVWGNLGLLTYGLGGLLIDVLTGPSAILVPSTRQEDEGMMVMLVPVKTPFRWEESGLYGGIGVETMRKHFRSEALPEGGADAGFSGWIGKRGRPLELVAKSFFYSSLNAVHSDSWEILSLGAQAAYRKLYLRFYPLVQGGLSYTITSTQGKGAPVGGGSPAGPRLEGGKSLPMA